MNILTQCQIRNEEENYKKIVDALEAIGSNNRTPEMDSELARAYNNLGDPNNHEGRKMYKKAIALLKPHEAYFKDDHCFNFRMGYAYVYLNQEPRALPYFEKALIGRPHDEDTEEFISWCKKRISCPLFYEPFKARVEKARQEFLNKEEVLRKMIDEDKNHHNGDELIKECSLILDIAFYDISFELGYNGNKYELILTPEGDKVKLFELVYFSKHAPKEIEDKWNIIVGRQPVKNMSLKVNDIEVNADDVLVWVNNVQEGIELSVYCEKTQSLLQEENKVWWLLTTLTDLILGEITHMRLVRSFNVLTSFKQEEAMTLTKLPEKLQEMGLDLNNDPQLFLELYSCYHMKPQEEKDVELRFDVISGSTSCPPLFTDYLDDDEFSADILQADGSVGGFFYYPLDGFKGEEFTKKVFTFRDKLEEYLIDKCGEKSIVLIGEATGTNFGYVDFITYDIQTVLNVAHDFFEESDEVEWANFHTFRRNGESVGLKYTTDDYSGEEVDKKGLFTGSVLLSKNKRNKEKLIHDLKAMWDIDVQEEDEEHDYALVFEMDGMKAILGLMPYPVPDGEAENAAKYNFMWEDAVNSAKNHTAHIIVAVMGKEEDVYEKGKLYVKILSACCEQPYVSGIYTSGVVFEPGCYEEFSNMMKDNLVPVYNWIWIGMYKNENGINAYTYGMDVFGKDEMEILGAQDNPNDIYDFLANIASYVLEFDVVLKDGDTIGNTEDDKHKITRSEAVSLDGVSLKISYKSMNTKQERVYDYFSDEIENMDMDNGAYHTETIIEKELLIEEINAYNHMAIYLRWCLEHNLMNEKFVVKYKNIVTSVKENPSSIDLRKFIMDELDGCLSTSIFNNVGRMFANYYYGNFDFPYFPSDIDSYSIEKIGFEKNYSDEIQDEAYLFIPFDEIYYQDMAKIIDRRFTNWQGQEFNKETMEPSKLAKAMMEYLDCKCIYFPSMKDDDPITSAYSYAKRDGAYEGYIPILVRVDDTLMECLIINSDPDSDEEDGYEFDLDKVKLYRKKMLSSVVKDGKDVLLNYLYDRKSEAQDVEMDWDEEIIGDMKGGYDNCRFSSYWQGETSMTYPLILAKIPVKNPWEIFAYLPFGGWNECPDTLDLMAIAKYWFEKYNAIPAAITHDELEFILPKSINKDEAIEVATEQYAFCPDIVDQEDDATIGNLADVLWRSTIWYFWRD